MTLIIARRDTESKKIFFVGDTRTTFNITQTTSDPYNLSPESGVFKFYRKSNFLIAFAGIVDEAHKLLSKIHNMNLNADEIVGYLKEFQNQSDFLVAIVREDQSSELYAIKNNMAEKVETAWIGNGDAFAAFQNFYIEDKSSGSLVTKMKSCLEQVIQTRKFQDVGGMVIPVYQFETTFSFETMALISGFNYVYNENDKYWGVGPGSTSMGTFTFESCDFDEAQNLIYFYFHQARILIMYKAEDGIIKCICNSTFSSESAVEEKISKLLGWNFKLQHSYS